MKKWVVLLFLIFAVFAVDVQAQTQIMNEKKFPFELNYAAFRASKGFSYLEIYYTLYRAQLKFVPDSARGFRANYTIQTNILEGDSVMYRTQLNKVTYADSLSAVKPTQRLPDITRLFIRPGQYTLRVKVTDRNSKRFGTVDYPIRVADFSKDSLQVSNLELASLIRMNKGKDVFTKNGYQVIPNPGALYGQGAPVLYFYAEIYNMAQAAQADSYRVNYQVVNGNGDVVRQFDSITRKKPGRSAVESAGVNIITLPSGSYFFRLLVHDFDSGKEAAAVKKFYVYRQADFKKQERKERSKMSKLAVLLNSPEYQAYDQMSEKALEAEFNGASYIATSQEKKVFKSLDLKGKREFMKKFWIRRDQDPTTLKNEFRQDYLERLAYVNAHFGSGKPGWRSDRGRVYLLYGKPDEIERNPSSSETKAYQVWHYYHIQGGIQFYFVDVRGFGDYQLVHSTARNELQDPNWQRWLQPF